MMTSPGRGGTIYQPQATGTGGQGNVRPSMSNIRLNERSDSFRDDENVQIEKRCIFAMIGAND